MTGGVPEETRREGDTRPSDDCPKRTDFRGEDGGGHPTVTPLQMIADAIRDVSGRGEIVPNLFGGSGSACRSSRRLRSALHGPNVETPFPHNLKRFGFPLRRQVSEFERNKFEF
jgi:hypothetical protein